MKVEGKNLYNYFNMNGKLHIQVPDWLFAKGDNHKLEAKLMDKTLIEYFAYVRDTFGATLVNYKSFIGFYIEDEDKMKSLVKVLNNRMRKKLNKKGV